VAFQQHVADAFAQHRIAHHDRHDVARVVEVRQTEFVEPSPHLRHALLLKMPLGAAGFQVADAGHGAGRNRWR